MVELLAGHTPMKVQQAAEGMPLEREHVYVIPPGSYLAIRGGALRLSTPRERHGARLPFDFLLRSMAEELGDRAIGVILSGTGADGSAGLKAIKEKAGLVIAQLPDEAAYDGMPRSAIMTGVVDLVLPVAEIPDALAKYAAAQVRRGRSQACPSERSRDRAIGRNRRAAAAAGGAGFRALQAGDAAAADRATHGAGGDHRWRPVSRPAAQERRRDRAPRQGPAHQRHQLLPRPQDLRAVGGEGHSRSRAPAAGGSAAADLGGGLQHGRGNLYHRHALPRGDRGGEAQYQAAGLRLGCRCGRGRVRPRRRLSGSDRGGRVRREACPFLRQGRAWLPGDAGAARRRGLHGAERSGRPAVLAPRPGLLPQPAHLSAPRGAGEGAVAFPFRAARGRHPLSRRLRDGGQFRRPLPADLQDAADLSPHRAPAAGGGQFLPCQPRERAGAAAPGPGTGGAVPARASAISPSGCCWRPTRRPRC